MKRFFLTGNREAYQKEKKKSEEGKEYIYDNKTNHGNN